MNKLANATNAIQVFIELNMENVWKLIPYAWIVTQREIVLLAIKIIFWRKENAIIKLRSKMSIMLIMMTITSCVKSGQKMGIA